MSRRPTRSKSAREPSKVTRQVGRFSVPIGVAFGLLSLAAAVAFVLNLVAGRMYPTVLAATQAAVFAGIAYSVGIQLPRNVRRWDAALDERARRQRMQG